MGSENAACCFVSLKVIDFTVQCYHSCLDLDGVSESGVRSLKVEGFAFIWSLTSAKRVKKNWRTST